MTGASRWLAMLLAVIIATGMCPAGVAAFSPPTYLKTVGNNQGRFNDIGAVALDAQGNMYIIDAGNHRIQKFDPQGNFLRFYGGYAYDQGTGHPGKFNLPVSVTIDGQGYLYVSDLENRRIQKLDQNGNAVMIITNTAARDIALDAAGNIYTVDWWTYLRKFDPAGNVLWQKGYREPDTPDDPYCLDRPGGLALGPDGNLYVADTWHGRIKKFDTEGNSLGVYHLTDDAIADVAFDSQGLMYVSQHYNGRIAMYRFDAGNPVWVRNFPSGYYSNTITLDAQDNLYITTFLDRMSKVDQSGAVLLSLGSNGKGDDEFCKPMQLARDAQGNVYLTDHLYRWFWSSYSNYQVLGNHRVRKLDHDGNLTLTFGKNGWAPGEFFWAPNDVSVDGAGNIYVCSNNHLIDGWNGYGLVEKFDAAGQFLSRFQVTSDTQPVKGMAIDQAGTLYLAWATRNGFFTTERYATDGQSLGSLVYPTPQWTYPQDVEVDAQGNIFMVDSNSLLKFGPDGTTLLFRKLGGESGIGQMYPGGLDVDAQGNVWVADSGNNRILCFANDGAFKFQFGTQGFGPGEFQQPRDICVVQGRLFVSDTFNQRVQIFTVGSPPTADAGNNVSLSSEQVAAAILYGTASDPDGGALTYRWVRKLAGGTTPLMDWAPVGANCEAPLPLSRLTLPQGTHTLILEVSDGDLSARDEMILTIENAAPHATVQSGPGAYEVGTAVVLKGEVADYDGDLLTYAWKEGDHTFGWGGITPPAGGSPVSLPENLAAGLTLGSHTLTLEVSDNNNLPQKTEFLVEIIDTQKPTLAPSVNKSLLWPPNHQMVDIVIQANAVDNNGLPVALTAAVSSSEPVEGTGAGDTTPDWTDPVINQVTGIITLQLRAERSGRSSGRIYTVLVTATDASGNSNMATVDIKVPHDQKKE
jgi:sugar lactone lactonase YvrE